ncbi:hypothetical protein CRENBAI_017261 [Crenichthys baileyi]|uniref:Uncharacterized protein n=1 Tax=Crenichthys baileyi TaxID=28760 RepID=A0AAV9R4I7_9TELE
MGSEPISSEGLDSPTLEWPTGKRRRAGVDPLEEEKDGQTWRAPRHRRVCGKTSGGASARDFFNSHPRETFDQIPGDLERVRVDHFSPLLRCLLPKLRP